MRQCLARRPILLGGTIIFALAGVPSCLPKLTTDQLRNAQPPRPVELDRLDQLLGKWETTGIIHLAVLDEPIHTQGRNRAEWTLDRRVLVDDAELDMGPLGNVTGQTLWTWDDSIGKYRMWWFDSLGETSQAVVTYNDRTRTWHMKATGVKYGQRTGGRGTIHHVDDDTLEWTWFESDTLGFITFAEMHGTSRRKTSQLPQQPD